MDKRQDGTLCEGAWICLPSVPGAWPSEFSSEIFTFYIFVLRCVALASDEWFHGTSVEELFR